ncbi:low-temperature-induced 65 kDa protein-like [Gastrolobium bilobum]|uniref:low-temperature-induced 65 kDa protein-like n=1 Tax=Gastrolobium bilobum TaxID=150636 RepID=UPI002AB2EF82|nr:low-temperature-induced 65 kDa protein-like [Gastrolobium bilobum]
MPQQERTYRHVNTSRSPTAATMEQFLRGKGESSRMSPTYSPTSHSPLSPYFERMKHHDPEEDQGLYPKKSVLTKVKERARKLRYSLSKRRQEDENLTPSWGVSLEEDEEEDDAEYLGAPIYESELAPDEYKENARQHPRASPVICEKHVLRSNVKSGVEQDQEKPLSPVKSTTTETQPTTTTTPCPNKTMTETVAEGSYAAHSMSSKNHAVSSTPPTNMSSQTCSITPPNSSFLSHTQNSSTSSPPLREKNTSSNNAGVMEKVRGAVNSLLRNEEPSQQYAVKTPTTRASSQITKAQQVDQEESHGRILQAN